MGSFEGNNAQKCSEKHFSGIQSSKVAAAFGISNPIVIFEKFNSFEGFVFVTLTFTFVCSLHS